MFNTLEVTIEGIVQNTTEITIPNNTNEIDVSIDISTNDYSVEVVQQNLEVSIDSVTQNNYNVEISLQDAFEINLIQENLVFDVIIESNNFATLISSKEYNRLYREIDGGLYVPEMTLDLVAIYEQAKNG